MKGRTLLRWGLIGFLGGSAVTFTSPGVQRSLAVGGDAALVGTFEAIGVGTLFAFLVVTIAVLLWRVTGRVP